MLIAAGMFIVVLAIVFGAYWIAVELPEIRAERALRERLKTGGPVPVKSRLLDRGDTLSALGPLDALLSRYRRDVEPLRLIVERSGLQMSLGALVLACVFLGLTAGVAVSFLVRSALLGLVVGALAACLPIWYVNRAKNRRIAAFEEQFPDAIDLLTRSFHIGHTLPAALQVAGSEMPDPAGAEFRRLFEEQNYGMSLDDALKAFARRMPTMGTRFFVTATLMQHQSGGNLGEVLNKLAAVIRERFAVMRQIHAISAHGRTSAWILGLMPLVVAGLLSVFAPGEMKAFVNDPVGVRLIAAAVALQAVGVAVIRRIIRVEY